MKIGLDLDETITAIPDLFSVFTRALTEAGHEVHIMTFRDPEMEAETRRLLDEHGISYTSIHLPPEDIFAPEWKRDLASRLDLEVVIDDSPEVLSEMPDGVHRVWVCDPEVFDLKTCVEALKRRP
ncbi:MAG: hypothetical protein ACE5GW_12590 [Planctomycetota bacterium]